MSEEEMAKQEADVEQQVWWEFAHIQNKAGRWAVVGGMTGCLVLEGHRAVGPGIKTEVHFARAGGCLRTAQEVRTLFHKSSKELAFCCLAG